MTIVTNVVFVYDDQTHVLTITVTKVEMKSHPSGLAQPSEPVDTVTEIDLSDLAL